MNGWSAHHNRTLPQSLRQNVGQDNSNKNTLTHDDKLRQDIALAAKNVNSKYPATLKDRQPAYSATVSA